MAKHNRRKQLKSTLVHFYDNPVAKVSLELFLSIGLILFLGIFAVRPTLLTMSDLLQEIDDKSELNSQLEKKVVALGTAQNEFRKHEDRLFLLDQAIPGNPELIRNLKIIEKTAVDNQIIIQNLGISEIPIEENAQSTADVKSLTNMPVTITVVGDYLSIRNFVESFHDNRRAIVIDSVTFSLDDNNDNKELSARISLNFPYFGTGIEKITK